MGTSNPEPFLLRWNDFYSNITTGFKDLRDDYEFLDVTVACEDEQLNAHKVILSACSPYFRSLLKKHPAQHPVLIMPSNVKYKFIHSLVDFMYHGEVAIPNEDLNQFLAIAEQFKVKGLSEEKIKPSNPKSHGQGPKSVPRPSPHPNAGPGVQQRLPPGIHMVKRQRGTAGDPHIPGKRPKLGAPQPPQPHSTVQPPLANQPLNQGFHDGDEDEDDDVKEIIEGDDSNDYYEAGHEGYEDQYGSGMAYADGTEAAQTMPPPAGPTAPAGGPQLMGLLCPNCRSMCQGVQALKDHMLVCQGQGGSGRSQASQPAYQANSGQPSTPTAVEDPQECHVCDKSFKSHRTLDNHMKKQHGITAPPKPQQGNRKPRRPKKVAGDTSESWQGPGYPQIGEDYDSQPNQQQYQGGFLESVTPEKQPKEVVNDKPVGQVAPAQRSIGPGHSPAPAPPKPQQTPNDNNQRPPSAERSGAPMAPGRPVRGRGAMMGRGMSRPHGAPHMRPGPGQEGPRPDLQKLGLKFGGQISITSTGNQARRLAQQQGGAAGGPTVVEVGGAAPGVSITKLKGDIPVGSPVSIRDATTRPGGATPHSQAGSTPGRGDPDGPVVKEEPEDFDVGEEELEEGDMEAGEQDDFGEYADYAEGDIGPGGDGMYGDEEDFEEMEGEGMEGEDDFSGRGGMFQGQYGAGEFDPDMEGEYEDEG